MSLPSPFLIKMDDMIGFWVAFWFFVILVVFTLSFVVYLKYQEDKICENNMNGVVERNLKGSDRCYADGHVYIYSTKYKEWRLIK